MVRNSSAVSDSRTGSSSRPPLWRRLVDRPAACLAAILLVIIGISALVAPVIAPYDPNAQDLYSRLLPVGASGHFLGTDYVGRDVLSRLIYGGRISLIVGFAAALIGAGVGTVAGLAAGYFRGWIDDVIRWLMNVTLAFPFILLMIAVVAVVGSSLTTLIVVLGLGSWAIYGRIVRGEVLAVSKLEFIEASVASGATSRHILFRQILPNVTAPIIVVASFEVASIILAQAALDYLGLGISGMPSWGGMLADAQDFMRTNWWLACFPGLAIMITVVCVNLLGDWLRDELDPQLSR